MKDTVVARGMSIKFDVDLSEKSPERINRFSLNATIRLSHASSNVSGTGLWKLSVYGSNNDDGSGDKFQPTDQLLSNSQQALPAVSGQNLTFTDLQGRLDFNGFGCDNPVRYLCVEFSKGDSPNPDFNLTSLQDDPTRNFICIDTCEQKEG